MIFVAMKNYFGGYVLVKIRGDYIERFFNMCAYRNIYIWDIKKSNDITTFKMSMRGFKSCRDICRKTHTQLSILQKFGAPSWTKGFKKRYVFFGGLILCVAFFAISSQFVWTIDIHGLKTESEQKLREKLASAGLKEGAYKGKFDLNDLKEGILIKDTNLSWIWVDLKGTKAIVTVREKQPIPYMVPTNDPCDIVSNKLGILVRKNVRTGVCHFQNGDTVFPGDVLISGTVISENADIPIWYVHAEGEFFLRTCYEKTGEFQLFAEKKIYTGQKTKRYYLHLLGREIPITFSKPPAYLQSNTKHEEKDLQLGRQHYMGIGYTVDTISEYKTVRVPLSLEEAKKRAKKRMKQEMDQSLSLHYTVVSEDYAYEETDHNTLKVTMNGQYEEQVGIEQKIDTTIPREDTRAKEKE